jgi:hypothetical protein
LPYNAVSGTKAITVATVSVKLEVSPAPPWTAGQTVTLKATVTRNGAPLPGVLVVLYVAQRTWHEIARLTTDSNGVVTTTWTIPWTIDTDPLPCYTIYFIAGSQGVWSNQPTGKCAYPTRISITAPDKVAPGASFTINGKLEYESASGVWSGLGGRIVSLLYNTTKIADVTTASDGSYSATASIPTSGTYTLKASYAGEGLATAAFLGLTVSPETKATLSFALPLVTGAIVALASLKAKR